MTPQEELTITLRGESTRRLREAARAAGRTPEELVADLAERGVRDGFDGLVERVIAEHQVSLDRLADL